MPLETLERPTTTLNLGLQSQAFRYSILATSTDQGTDKNVEWDPYVIEVGKELKEAAEKADAEDKPQASSTLAVPKPTKPGPKPTPTPAEPVGASGRIYSSGTSPSNPANPGNPTSPHPGSKDLPQKPKR
jgi:hypothetical protein